MEIRIDFAEELKTNVLNQISFLNDEFDQHFAEKTRYNPTDRALAADLLNHFSKLIDTPVCLDQLSQTLEHLEVRYPGLF